MFAELGAMQIFRGVFSGALIGFVLLAPLGVVLGAGVSIWRPADKRPFIVLATFICVVLFAGIGALLPPVAASNEGKRRLPVHTLDKTTGSSQACQVRTLSAKRIRVSAILAQRRHLRTLDGGPSAPKAGTEP